MTLCPLLHSATGIKPSCQPSSKASSCPVLQHSPSLTRFGPFLPTVSLTPSEKLWKGHSPEFFHKCLLSQYMGGRGTAGAPATCGCSHRIHPLEKM